MAERPAQNRTKFAGHSKGFAGSSGGLWDFVARSHIVPDHWTFAHLVHAIDHELRRNLLALLADLHRVAEHVAGDEVEPLRPFEVPGESLIDDDQALSGVFHHSPGFEVLPAREVDADDVDCSACAEQFRRDLDADARMFARSCRQVLGRSIDHVVEPLELDVPGVARACEASDERQKHLLPQIRWHRIVEHD